MARIGWRLIGFARRLLASLGLWPSTLWRYTASSLSVAVAVIGRACRPLTWRRPVRAEFMRHCAQVAVQGLLTIVIAGVLVGIAIVYQVLYWLSLVGETDLIGDFLVLVLVREVAPVLVGLIVIGRSGTCIIAELGQMQAGGQMHMLDAQGIDPFLYVFVPRVLATALGAFCLSVIFLVVALSTGLVTANALGVSNMALLDFSEDVLTSMGPKEYVLIPAKTLLIGFTIGLISCTTGLADNRAAADTSMLLSTGFARSILAILVISGTLTALL